MIWLPITLLSIYILGISYLLLIHPKKTEPPTKKGPKDTGDLITIIIPVRNEEKNISRLLSSISTQQIKHEIIIVNDHSDDNTVHEVEDFIKRNNSQHIKLLHLQEFSCSPKKAAISLAIQEATGEIIVTTDGDCVVPPNWLTAILNSFQNQNTKMVLGGVNYSPSLNLFEKIQAYELCALLTISMTMAEQKKPFTCNGANLAYRKSVFFEVNGFDGIDNIASGDDELLMKKIAEKHPLGINIEETAFVDTLPNKTITQFFHQRIRWASKWKFGTWKDKTPGAFVMLVYLSLGIIPYSLSVQHPNCISQFLIFFLLVLKFILDSQLIKKTRNKTSQEPPFNYGISLLLYFIYPIYVIIIGFSATFLKFSWKGRTLN